MKIFGYSIDIEAPSFADFIECKEINLTATPDELLKISSFLASVANEMICMGAKFDHAHLGDRCKEFDGSPHFVVYRSEGDANSSSSVVGELIQLGKKQGYLTKVQVLSVLPKEIIDSDQISDIFSLIIDMGINIQDQ